MQHLRSNQLPEAETLCRQILSHQSDHAGALQLLGVIRAEKREFQLAADFIRQAIQLQPDWPDAHYNLGNVLQMAGALDQAAAAYRQAIKLRTDWPEAWNNLGLALKGAGQNVDAITAFERATSINPKSANAWNNLGNALKDAGELKRSAAVFQRAIAINPNLPEAYNNLSVVFKEAGEISQSMEHASKAIELRPRFAEAHNNLGTVLEEMGHLDEAAEAFQQAIAASPHYAEAHYNLGNVLKSTRRLSAAIASYRQALTLKPDLIEAHNNLLYALHFHPDYGPAEIASEHRRWNVQHAQPLKRLILPHTNDPNPERRLRVGYVSPNFSEHPVGRFLLPLFSEHDHRAFEIFAYSQVAGEDSVTRALRMHVDAWRNIRGVTDSGVAELIRIDQIDILVDLTIHMARNRMLVFARKPAPVQVTWLAYCSTTGLETIDYRLSDPYLEPADSEASNCSEKTIILPETYWCYQPSEVCPDINELPARTGDAITFGCLNNFSKISEPAVSLWTQILQSIPQSQLLLHSPQGRHRQELCDQFQKDRIDPSRLQFVGKLPLADYFRLYHRTDIALDTLPYAGGTTTCDALWMGVPVVTLAGRTAVGRGGVSILSNIGLGELIAENKEQYVQLAVALADDLPRLTQLRATMRERMRHSLLMNAARFTANMEAAYRRMWESWCSGKTESQPQSGHR